ncbi:hypothetical protein KQX54_017595 [Cotesia glomerata]|uniref:Uncharacterized protein n=1 Tax=Cotesia glomerata TaxID=32391 RepID=A0AAV7HT11_COTGL|nr:hypothetical protein KQX54_017595 [Cotesia glomerata]
MYVWVLRRCGYAVNNIIWFPSRSISDRCGPSSGLAHILRQWNFSIACYQGMILAGELSRILRSPSRILLVEKCSPGFRGWRIRYLKGCWSAKSRKCEKKKFLKWLENYY